jgi:predicted nucleic acid-binding protein
MPYLLDTGIILRLVNKMDRQHSTVRNAVRELVARNEQLLVTTQIVAEFCNVVTRPVQSNGLGMPPAEAMRLLEHDIEPIGAILVEHD